MSAAKTGTGHSAPCPPRITILPVRPADCPRLTQIARAAKAHWDYPPEWLTEWRDVLTVTSDYLNRATVHKAVLDGTIVGFYALRGGADGLELDHLWVTPEVIGQGVGRLLFAHAVDAARGLGAHRIVVESDPNAVGFYEHMGGVRVGVAHGRVAGTQRQLPILELPV